jgi:spermidine/putrescine-binding protein
VTGGADSGLTRRDLLAAGAGAALGAYGLAGLAGCTVERQVDKSAAGQIIKPEIDGDLLLFNWAQYMDPALKKGFAEEYGVEVNEVNFDNLEAMVIKLRAGGEYDLIWPSTGRLSRTPTASPPSTRTRGTTPTTSTRCRTRTTRPGSPGATTRCRG